MYNFFHGAKLASTVLISPRPNFATLTFKVRHSYIIALTSIILIYLKATSFLQTFPFQNLLLRNINFDHRLFNKKQQFTLIFKSSRIRESEAMFRKFHLTRVKLHESEIMARNLLQVVLRMRTYLITS